jgi:GNAT superfamily N-acetyltransferase
MTFSIRLAGPTDADAIGAVSVRGWQWGYRGLMPDELLAGLDPGERAEGWLALLTSGDLRTRIHVAEQEGAVVGFVSAGPSREPEVDERTAEIYAIYVEERVAGSGVGAALLERAVDDLWKRGFHRAMLWVLETNARARHFYERQGWIGDGGDKTETYRGVPLHEIRYRLAP